MMKCSKMMDWLDVHFEEATDPAWQDLVAHARTCPDCSFFLKTRAQIIETMREMPVPEPPKSLQAMIMNSLEFAPVEEPEQESFIDRWLPSMQVALCVVCVSLILSVFLRHSPSPVPGQDHSLRVASVQPKAKRLNEAAPGMTRGEGMVKMSESEIASFLQRLDDYKRLHPEMESRPLPALDTELVRFPSR